MATATCTATKTTPTATGDLPVTCGKPATHLTDGDPVHEAWVGVFPVRWREGQQPN